MFCTRQTLWRYNKSLPYMAVKMTAAVEVVKSSQNKTGSPLYNFFCIIPSFFPLTFYTYPTMHFDWQVHVGPGPLLSWPYAFLLPVMVHYGICAMVYWACVRISCSLCFLDSILPLLPSMCQVDHYSVLYMNKNGEHKILSLLLCCVQSEKMGVSVTHLFCSQVMPFILMCPQFPLSLTAIRVFMYF